MREIRTLRSTWRGLETWHGIGLNRRASPRPYLGAPGGAIPPGDSTIASDGLTDRSRRPYRHANQLPVQIEMLIVRCKQDKPHWGAPKIRERLARLYPDVHTLGDPMPAFLSGPGPRPTPTPAC